MSLNDRLKALLEISGGLQSAGEARVTVPVVKIPKDLCFDDEPLEDLLFKPSDARATSASIFSPARDLITTLNDRSSERSPAQRVSALVEFLNDHHAVPKEVFRSLSAWLASFLPKWPNPPSPDIPSQLGEGLDLLWGRANQCADEDLILIAGGPLWEWNELKQEHAKARTVLKTMIDINLRRGMESAAASQMNNYAFQYWCERNWSEAARWFSSAASLEKKLGRVSDHANAKTNYWACRFEEEGLTSSDVMISELERYAEIQRRARKSSGERKALIYLAKIAQKQEDFRKAIPLVERAVELDHALNSLYTQSDEQFLEELKKAQK